MADPPPQKKERKKKRKPKKPNNQAHDILIFNMSVPDIFNFKTVKKPGKRQILIFGLYLKLLNGWENIS